LNLFAFQHRYGIKRDGSFISLTLIRGDNLMDTNILKGSWDVVKGKVKEQWGKLTDDDLREIDGRKDHLIGKLEWKYGQTKEETKKMVDEFEKYLK